MTLKEKATQHILEIYRDNYDDDKSDEEILAFDPNEYEVDPENFYEDVLYSFFGMGTDVDIQGGTVQELIDQVAAKWDGSDIDRDWMENAMPDDF
ncbi:MULTISPECIES: hypothetical protein [unclassified Hahella]|uniref:hypothetical protein n=1 Tax=unclassified Hahella TaxID=2624107 RepID=UPI001C1E91DB|nr:MULTISPECIES: hypothetical protein [unclassified Hahella]MBU6955846.1 hypothetical protein [Hahella sp. HN01]MDG9670900.1 hypothetical protein [Hahella sp. CR1]